jgi:hypothetical protein
MQCNALNCLGKCWVQREWVRGSQRQKKKSMSASSSPSRVRSRRVVPARSLHSLLRGTEYKGGSRYGARACDGWHGELGLACAGTLVSRAGSSGVEQGGETRRDEARRGCPIFGLAVSKRCAFICIYVCMYACRKTFVLLLRCRWRERRRMVWTELFALGSTI